MNFRTLSVLIYLIAVVSQAALPQALINNDAKIYIKQGAKVYVKTNSVNNSRLIDNAGELTIEQDFTNNDTATAGGANGVYNVQRDWINNSVFIANQGKVNLYGDVQLITGTAVTIFYDLELIGTGIKRQTINSETSHLLSLNDRELATDSFEMLVSNPDPAAITRSTGFVSSLGSGRLSRNTDDTSTYLFPTGSSVGTLRYRPIEISSDSSSNSTFGARLANTDATAEGFNRNMKDSAICEVNPLFYHRIYRTNGTSPVDIKINYDPVADGDWQDAAHWQNIPQWEPTNATASLSPPFSSYIIYGWNDFAQSPFALIRKGPDLSLTSRDATCKGANDGAVIANTSGGNLPYHYNWSTGDTSSGLYLIPGGSYILTVTDNLGCSASKAAVINEPNNISTIESITQTLCEESSDGAIKLISIGGTPPHHVLWNTGDTTFTITSLELGVYGFVITDDNGCVLSDSIALTSESTYSVEADATNASCNGIANGSVSASIISGSTPPYTYLWNTSDTTVSVSNVPAGNYSVTVYDALSCIKVDTVSVGITGLTIDEAVEDASCPGIADGSIQTFISGGTPPYSFAWSSGATSSSLVNIYAGTYSLSVTDQFDCDGNKTITVLADSTADCDNILIYDVFSPNGDGANDLWIIEGLLPKNEHNDLQIFNRWGNLVYEAKPYDNSWDGRSKNNEPLPVATYYYILKLNDANAKVFSGSVTLMR